MRYSFKQFQKIAWSHQNPILHGEVGFLDFNERNVNKDTKGEGYDKKNDCSYSFY